METLDMTSSESPTKGYVYRRGDRPLDGYTIQRAIGRGGFGEVYYAVSDSGREIALKAVQGFEEIELRGISQCMNLKSPYLVSIFDIKHNDKGKPFVIMEYVRGPSLLDIIRDSSGGLGIQKTAYLAREIAKGLTYLHDRGLVHRDLKPGNIFYEDGYVKIGDYGLSKAINVSPHSGQTINVGTLHYMAPEIGSGRYARSIDIYAFGAVLYEMFTGQPPFMGESAGEILMKHVAAEVETDSIPDPIGSTIRKAMAKNPDDRYQTAQDLVEAIFGVDHIRNSVSQFAPASLSLAAERVEDHVITPGDGIINHALDQDQGSDTGEADEQASAAPGEDQLKHVVRERMNHAAEEFGKLKQRFREEMASFGDQPSRSSDTPDEQPQTEVKDEPTDPKIETDKQATKYRYLDPLSIKERAALAGIVIFLTSSVAALWTGRGDLIVGVWWFNALAATGGTFGILFAKHRSERTLEAEGGFIKRIAIGGTGAVTAMLTSAVSLVAFHHDELIAALSISIMVPITLMDWKRHTYHKRRDRVSFGVIAMAASLGFLISLLFRYGSPFLAMTTMTTIALSVQIMAPLAIRRVEVETLTPEPDPLTGAQKTKPVASPSKRIRRTLNAKNARNTKTVSSPTDTPKPASECRRLWAVILTFGALLGVCGLQRIYVGRVVSGIVWMLTFGLLGFGQLIDLILIIVGKFRDHQYRPVINWVDDIEHQARPVNATIDSAHNAAAPPVVQSQHSRMIPIVLSAFGYFVVAATTVLATTLVVDVPNMLAAGLPDYGLAIHLRENVFGYEAWPRLIHSIANKVTTGSYAIAAIALIIAGRHSQSFLHIVRVPMGLALLLAAQRTASLAIAPAWTEISELFHDNKAGPAIEMFLEGINETRLIIALLLLISSITLIVFPSSPTNPSTPQPEGN